MQNYWLIFKKDDALKVAPLIAKGTLGSAKSNAYVLLDRNIQPLQGQFSAPAENGEIHFRRFGDRVSICLSSEQSISIGHWKVWVKNESQFYQEIFEDLNEAFKTVLKEMNEKNIERALEILKERSFFNLEIPEPLKRKFRSVFSEFSLSGPIETLLSDTRVTDILVESYDRIWVERSGQLELSNCEFTTPESYEIYIENLLSHVHKSVDESMPYVDFNLPDGSRGHLITSPVTSMGSRYLSIRKIRKNFFTLEDLLGLGMFDALQLQKLLKIISGRKNLLVSGSTGSGKTTLIKALLHKFPSVERVLVIEDTPELILPRENTAFLCTRIDARGTLPPVTLRHLIRQSLRMRPDRILIGEVRGEEALDLLHAMNTGHRGCMGSLHANSAKDALFRFQGLVQMASASLSESATWDSIRRNIHAVLHVGKNEKGQRKLLEILSVEDLKNDRIVA